MEYVHKIPPQPEIPGEIEMVIAGGYPDIKGGTKWIGTDGWVHVTRGDFSASNEAWTEWLHCRTSSAK